MSSHEKPLCKSLLLGAHTSTSGGLHNALLEGQKIGATTIQLFTSNQKQWAGKTILPESISLWEEALQKTQIQCIMSHDSYLINLASGDPDILAKSRKAFGQEISRCIALKLTYLNFHPGAAVKDDPDVCIDCIVESLLSYEPLLENQTLRLLLETTAGQGTSIGHRFEHLAYIINRVKDRIRIGVCIDTCHIFAAGYDIRTSEGWDTVLKEFDSIVGLEHLYAFHLNDSLKPLGSRVDRHKPIGEGQIGLDSFKCLMSDPRTRDLPKYLETPGGPNLWVKEIELLRNL